MAAIRGVEGKRLMYSLKRVDHADDTWAVAATDLRCALARTGVSEAIVERVIAGRCSPWLLQSSTSVAR